MSTARKDKSLVVAAIDFGTTFSGYAFSFKDDFRTDPLKIFTNTEWKDESGGLVTYKTPTSILFNENGEFHSFGFDAETFYAEKIEEEEEKGWKFFKRFKMALYREVGNLDERLGQISMAKTLARKKLSREIKMKDDQGQNMHAMKIFSASIGYLKGHFMKRLKDSIKGIKDDDIHWILTVPAIWSDPAKQFMRESAFQAGIHDDQLTLALEPEAAAIYCKQIAVRRNEEGDTTALETFVPGEQFLLIDMGGGTVDITCHEVMNDGKLKELYRPSGGPWGGTNVDAAYFQFLQNLFGKDVWDNFIKENLSEKLEIERVFEMKKRSVKPESDKIVIRVGSTIINEYEKKKKESVEKMLEKSVYSESVQKVKEKFKIQGSILNEMFKEPVKDLIEHVQRLLAQRQLSAVKTLILVGGFSESAVVKDKIKAAFPDKSVINPVDASLAVLKGAVLFGHSPSAICERSSPRTYGICVSAPWDPKRHPTKCHHVVDDKEVCTDIFQVMVSVGQPLVMGKTVATHTCRPAKADDTIATVEIYESTDEEPLYTFNQSSRRLGDLQVRIPDTRKGKDRKINIEMHFGFTELKVSATEIGTNHKAEIKFDCLSTTS